MLSLNHILIDLMIPSFGDTQSAEFWLKKGNELANSGMMEDAIKAYSNALEIDESLIDAWNNKGMVLANLGRYSEAKQCFDDALKRSPRHAQALSNKGMILAQEKKYQEALILFDAAIESDPYFAGAWYNKSLAMQCLGRGREAKAAMKTAKSLDGSNGGRCRR